MKRHLSFMLLAASLFACETRYETVSFFFAGHQDDWQLFMGNVAFENIREGHKVVFVITTAGDASLGTGIGTNASYPYYLTREKAVINSAILAVDGSVEVNEDGMTTKPLRDYQLQQQRIDYEVNGRKSSALVNVFPYGNSRTYVLRLPDGFPRGQYPLGMYQLKSGKTENLYSLDSLLVFENWSELAALMRGIVSFESAGIPKIWINAAEKDSTLNPGDHFDHLHASMLADVASEGNCVNKRYFVEYHSAELEPNISKDEVRIKQWLFSPCAISKVRSGYRSSWDDFHLAWTMRSYYREEICEDKSDTSHTTF